MVAFAANGQRRKPAIGRFGEITVEQARTIAKTGSPMSAKAMTKRLT